MINYPKIFEVQEQFNIEDLSKNKIEILVNNNIILMNKSNLTFLDYIIQIL